ncbi:N-acetyltransferase family protein [Clostridium paraputrificum]|uniref:GNAT family N-acetyltransferase n=1 Tax=Clostridium paraputrificum TaxID=29363 RepID=UPI003D326973
MRYISTKYDEFKLRETTAQDTSLILSFIKGIAEYEKMGDEVVATEETLRKSIFQDNRAKVLIAEVYGKPIGFALYFFNFSTFIGKAGLYLEDIFIQPEYRGKGYGKEIFIVLAKIAEENSCERMEWVCLDWNKPSIKFYKSFGSIPMDEWTTYRLVGDKIKNLANS